MKMVMWLDSVGEDESRSVGIRAMELSKLLSHGVSVPEGFVITSETFGVFLKETGIGKRIHSLIESTDAENSSAMNACSETIKGLFIKTRIPWYIEVDLLSAYKKFSMDAGFTDEYVTVIPSRLEPDPMDDAEEDEETYVDVLGKSELFDVVKRCWASQYTPRQIARMKATKSPFDAPQMGILVQRVAGSDVSGIAFTVDPLSGKDNIQIQAIRGLVDALTEEGLQPDIYTVDRATKEITDRRTRAQAWMLVRNENGDYEKKDLPEEDRRAQKLADSNIKSLAELALKAEEILRSPVEIEWTLEGKKLYVETIERIEVPKKRAEPKKKQDIEITPSVAYAASNLGQHPVVPAKEEATAKVNEKEELIEESNVRESEPEMPSHKEASIASSAAVAPVVEIIDHSKNSEKKEKPSESEKEKKTEPQREPSVKIVREFVPVTSTKMHIIADASIGNEDDASLLGANVVLVGTGSIYQALGKHPNAIIEEGEWKLVEGLCERLSALCRTYERVVVETCALTSAQLRMLKLGEAHETREMNPLIGVRGASRYRTKKGAELFQAELKAIKRCRDDGARLDVAIPFARLPEDVEAAIEAMHAQGLGRSDTMKLYLSELTPSALFNAPVFAKLCDGFIADLDCAAQLVMACEDESEALRKLGYYDRTNEAIWNALILLSKATKELDKPLWIKARAYAPPKPWIIDELVRSGLDALCIPRDDLKAWLTFVSESERRVMHERMKSN